MFVVFVGRRERDCVCVAKDEKLEIGNWELEKRLFPGEERTEEEEEEGGPSPILQKERWRWRGGGPGEGERNSHLLLDDDL